MSHFEGLTRHLDARPLRLQPSPSLPNLRSAPRDRRPRQQPHPTPRKHSVQLPIATEDAHVKDHLSKEGVDGGVGQRHRDHTTRGNHHYLTPPLTPSSSLKSDSSGPDCAELYPDEEQPSCADDASSNRFLIIKNVPDDLLGPDIHQCINYLASISSADRADYGPSFPSPKSDNSPSLSIQTVYHRPNEIVIAFHDVRDANRVKCFIDAKGNTEAAEGKAKGKQRALNEGDLGLTCAYLTQDQLRELLGPSACITKTEGQFCVSVDHVPSGTRDYSASPVTSWSRSRFSVPVKMKSILMKHGDFKPIQLLQDSACRQVYFVEYYDVRSAQSAWDELDRLVIDGVKLELITAGGLRDGCSGPPDIDFQKHGTADDPEGEFGGEYTAEPKTPTASTSLSASRMHDRCAPAPGKDEVTQCRAGHSATGMDSDGGSSRPSMEDSAREEFPFVYPINTCGSSSDADHSLNSVSRAVNEFSSVDKYGRRGSNHVLFDAIKRHTTHGQNVEDNQPRAIYTADTEDSYAGLEELADMNLTSADTLSGSYGNSQIYHTGDYYRGGEYFPLDTTPVQATWFPSSHVPAEHAAAMQYPSFTPPPFPPAYAGSAPWVPLAPGNPPRDHWPPYPAHQYYYATSPPQPMVDYSYSTSTFSPPSAPYHPQYPYAYPQPYLASPQRPVAEHNQLDIKKIEIGQDTRTTVMVKNIPNKMTDRELISYINKVCPRRIDFLYLRMDFQNGCNVGYAFVNFISVEDLLQFAKQRLNQRWNIYSSEKVLQMSYANYQGKEALVEKFKNSCIMDEREEWRPKIFYSEPGPNQGKPEPFPKPTHMRRKERSSFNRGALFVPGINSAAGHHRTYLNADPPHQRGQPHRPHGYGEDKHRRRGGHDHGQFGPDGNFTSTEHHSP